MPLDFQNLPGTGSNGDHRVFSNYYSDEYVIQNALMIHPKSLVMDILRRRFSLDSVFTYRIDEFGFPLTPDLTGGDIDSEDTTKILISDGFRNDVKFYPNIIIKANGGSYKPLSFNQNGTVKYRKDMVETEFGNKLIVNTPTHRIYAGFWDLNFDVVISSESLAELQRIVDIVAMELQYSSWNELRAGGVFIKGLSISAESEEPYANDYVYKQTISISTHSEWRVEIPLDNVIEKLVFYFDSTRTPIPPNAGLSDLQSLRYDDVIELAEITL